MCKHVRVTRLCADGHKALAFGSWHRRHLYRHASISGSIVGARLQAKDINLLATDTATRDGWENEVAQYYTNILQPSVETVDGLRMRHNSISQYLIF